MEAGFSSAKRKAYRYDVDRHLSAHNTDSREEQVLWTGLAGGITTIKSTLAREFPIPGRVLIHHAAGLKFRGHAFQTAPPNFLPVSAVRRELKKRHSPSRLSSSSDLISTNAPSTSTSGGMPLATTGHLHAAPRCKPSKPFQTRGKEHRNGAIVQGLDNIARRGAANFLVSLSGGRQAVGAMPHEQIRDPTAVGIPMMTQRINATRP